MTGDVVQLTAALIGVLVPMVFAVFVFLLTRRRGASGEDGALLAMIARLRREMVKSFAADKGRQ